MQPETKHKEGKHETKITPNRADNGDVRYTSTKRETRRHETRKETKRKTERPLYSVGPQ
jgi:hypothetical protein